MKVVKVDGREKVGFEPTWSFVSNKMFVMTNLKRGKFEWENVDKRVDGRTVDNFFLLTVYFCRQIDRSFLKKRIS